MLNSITQFIGPFGATFVLCLIALGIMAVLRDGVGDEDRRSFSSDLASKLGILGMIFLPVSALAIVWSVFQSAILSASVPVTVGIVAGAFAALVTLGRQALLPKKGRSAKNGPTEQVAAPNRSAAPSLKSESSLRDSRGLIVRMISAMARQSRIILLTTAVTLLAVGFIVDARLNASAREARSIDAILARWRDSKKISAEEYFEVNQIVFRITNPRFHDDSVYRYITPAVGLLTIAAVWCQRRSRTDQRRSNAEQAAPSDGENPSN